MQSSISLADQIRGCILLGAVGDSLGASYEGQPGPIAYRKPAITEDVISNVADSDLILRMADGFAATVGKLIRQS